MQQRLGPSYDQSRELRVRPDLKTLQLDGQDKLGFSKIQHDTKRMSRELSTHLIRM